MISWQIPAHNRQDFSPRRSDWAVLIPVLNEGERFRAQLRAMHALKFGVDVFVVDGGSNDGSVDSEFLAAHGVRSLLVKTGPGRLGAQLRVGLAAVLSDGYRGVVLIDGNGKDDPSAIPEFLSALESGYDHIQGSRFQPGGVALNTPLLRYAAIRLVHAPMISRSAGFRYTDTTNGFRAYSARFLEDPRVAPFRDVFSQYELHYYLAIRSAQLGYRVCEVPVARRYPSGGVIPTKIRGLRGHWLLLRTLINCCGNRYTPS